MPSLGRLGSKKAGLSYLLGRLGQFAVALVSSAEVPTLASLSALRSLWQKHWALAFSDSRLVILRFSMRDLRPPGAVFEFKGLCSVSEALKHPSFGWSVCYVSGVCTVLLSGRVLYWLLWSVFSVCSVAVSVLLFVTYLF